MSTVSLRGRGSMVLLVAAATTLAAACGSGGGNGAAHTTPTTVHASTTTAPKPAVADANAAIAAFAKTREGSNDVSIGDIDDDTITDVSAAEQTPVRIASVIKTSIAIAYLRQLQQRGQTPSSLALAQLKNMIEQSDNEAAEELWEDEQGSDALLVTERAAGLTHTAYQVGHGWGFTLTTAHDQAKLATALARGQMLNTANTDLVLDFMHHVVSSEQWGFADSVDPSIAPAIKNGWYEDTDAPVWRIHCTAIFDSPLLAHHFSIAVMTRYPSQLGMGYGEDTCRGVAQRLGAWLTKK